MLNKIKANIQGLVKGDLFITLNKNDMVFIVKSSVQLTNIEKHYITKQVKKVNSDLVVFFR